MGEDLARGTTPLNPRGRDELIRPIDTPGPRGHDSPPYTQRSRLWVITPQLLIRHQPAS